MLGAGELGKAVTIALQQQGIDRIDPSAWARPHRPERLDISPLRDISRQTVFIWSTKQSVCELKIPVM
jgi:hypothetical protein